MNTNTYKNVSIFWDINLPVSSQETVLTSLKFTNWFDKANQEFIIEAITIQSVDFFGAGRVGFIKLIAKITDKDGHKLPGVVFIRGNSVSVMLNIKNTDTGEDFVALVQQGRVPIGKAECFESPAGMMDEEHNITGVAIKEVEEELHMHIDSSKLIPLTEVFTSPGGQDEQISLFAYEHQMSSSDLNSLHGKITGEEGSSEKIKVHIVPLHDFLKYNKSAAGQLAYRTYIMDHKK